LSCDAKESVDWGEVKNGEGKGRGVRIGFEMGRIKITVSNDRKRVGSQLSNVIDE
jgi:hypothetical protein